MFHEELSLKQFLKSPEDWEQTSETIKVWDWIERFSKVRLWIVNPVFCFRKVISRRVEENEDLKGIKWKCERKNVLNMILSRNYILFSFCCGIMFNFSYACVVFIISMWREKDLLQFGSQNFEPFSCFSSFSKSEHHCTPFVVFYSLMSILWSITYVVSILHKKASYRYP